MSDPRTLLLLGASGFLGAWLARRAPEALPGWRVVGTRGTRSLERPPGSYRALDLADPRQVDALLSELAPSLVLNAAALSRIDHCEEDPDLARRLNTELPEQLASFTAATGTRLVHVSTDLVFDGEPPEGRRYREQDPPSPLHAYGESKVAGEERVQAADPGALVVRLPLLYGDSLDRGLGASDSLLAALARKQRPGLFSDEWRTPLRVDSAADALLELAGTPAAGLLHVAGAQRLTRFELGIACLRAHGWSMISATEAVRESTRVEAGLARTRARDVSLDASRARSLLRTPLRGAPSP